ncbi:hypothetical protein DL762_003545 [Monosporascus cannonballus]|uniref:Peroxisomal membrane protein PEX17 n=1 Tax=Monosporascus cannonballus TaxID=155416 RepID=A0ABY0HAR8_9PEZI|nr:hypothetical protein DL762_003545 [Monosporascus cannonballus]
MPADRMLTTVLRAYQDPPSVAATRIDAIFGTTTSLLSTLNNPLNLSLLTSHFLTARAIWQQHPLTDLRTCLRVISVYNTAAFHVRRNELESAHLPPGQPRLGGGLSADEWARAVAKGADDRSSRWRHCLVLTGMLMGMEAEDRRSLSRGLRGTLEEAVVTAANLALEDPIRTGPLGSRAVVLALTYAFPLLSDFVKGVLNCNALLPAIVEGMVGEEGFQNGDFVRAISADIAPEQNVWWSANSPSVGRLQNLVSRPLVQNMGPLSRLAAFAVQHAAHSNIVLQSQDDLLDFTARLLDAWGQCPLSGIDMSVETTALSPEVLQGPWPMLWELLKKIMYTVVATLQPIMGRTLLDPYLRRDFIAPAVASKTLHTLRNLSFVSSRQGASAFHVYTFTYLTSIDIITRYPEACIAFLEDTQPPPPPAPQNGQTTPPPLAQALTLFYLNAAEHLPFSISTPACETLIIAPATSLLAPTSWLSYAQIQPESPSSLSSSQSQPPENTAPPQQQQQQQQQQLPPPALALELFEASHSCVLSALSCPQHGALAASLVPYYVDALLSSFPARVSPRQFRLAFRTVAQIAGGPPFPLAASHPDLAETLLEMVRWRAVEGGASTAPLPSSSSSASASAPERQPPLSEQTALLLALVDAIPYLPLHAVEEWLTRAALALPSVPDPAMRDAVRRRICEVLASGKLDVERAALGVAWWGVGGGRELVLFGLLPPGAGGAGGGDGQFMMSGALGGGGHGENVEKERSRL